VLNFRSLLAGTLAIVLTIQPAFAWSECGHNIIAILAYDLMKPEQQKRAAFAAQLLGTPRVRI